jgi:hypothetical protein
MVSCLFAELGDVDLKNMKMLQRVRSLETTGQTFASKMLKDLPVFGKQPLPRPKLMSETVVQTFHLVGALQCRAVQDLLQQFQ